MGAGMGGGAEGCAAQAAVADSSVISWLFMMSYGVYFSKLKSTNLMLMGSTKAMIGWWLAEGSSLNLLVLVSCNCIVTWSRLRFVYIFAVLLRQFSHSCPSIEQAKLKDDKIIDALCRLFKELRSHERLSAHWMELQAFSISTLPNPDESIINAS